MRVCSFFSYAAIVDKYIFLVFSFFLMKPYHFSILQSKMDGLKDKEVRGR